MNAVDAAILGLVEGLTEYLPISSTGHLIIASAVLGLNEPESLKRSVDAYTIIIQGAAILAVLGLYWNRIRQMVRGITGQDSAGLRLAVHLMISFLPAAVIGVLIVDWVEKKLFHPGPVIAALALGGVVMVFLTRWQRSFFNAENVERQADARRFVDLEHLTWRRALLIGLLQCLAIWPGTSRSMMTIIGGMLIGLRPKDAAEYSFLLALPTLGGACLYRLVKNLLCDDANMFETLELGPIFLGFLVALLSASIAIKWLVAFLSTHGVAIFGWYRLALCAVLALLIWRGVISMTP